MSRSDVVAIATKGIPNRGPCQGTSLFGPLLKTYQYPMKNPVKGEILDYNYDIEGRADARRIFRGSCRRFEQVDVGAYIYEGGLQRIGNVRVVTGIFVFNLCYWLWNVCITRIGGSSSSEKRHVLWTLLGSICQEGVQERAHHGLRH